MSELTTLPKDAPGTPKVEPPVWARRALIFSVTTLAPLCGLLPGVWSAVCGCVVGGLTALAIDLGVQVGRSQTEVKQ